MRKILCWLGFHRWRVTHYEQDVFWRIHHFKCEHCSAVHSDESSERWDS